MIRNVFLLLTLALIGFGCASDNAQYGLEPSPVVQHLDGQDQTTTLREKIIQDNVSAQEEGDAPIFNYDDNGGPE